MLLLDGNSYRFPKTAPLSSETHGGDDVGIFASGPWSHLLTGVVEQNVIPHVMAYAACVGDGATSCDVSTCTYLHQLMILQLFLYFRKSLVRSGLVTQRPKHISLS